MHHKQEEILILKMIGAADAYILRPFSYSGLWVWFIGCFVGDGLITRINVIYRTVAGTIGRVLSTSLLSSAFKFSANYGIGQLCHDHGLAGRQGCL